MFYSLRSQRYLHSFYTIIYAGGVLLLVPDVSVALTADFSLISPRWPVNRASPNPKKTGLLASPLALGQPCSTGMVVIFDFLSVVGRHGFMWVI
jgi:hypothetical protein